jgi:hypothetical protein
MQQQAQQQPAWVVVAAAHQGLGQQASRPAAAGSAPFVGPCLTHPAGAVTHPVESALSMYVCVSMGDRCVAPLLSTAARRLEATTWWLAAVEGNLDMLMVLACTGGGADESFAGFLAEVALLAFFLTLCRS